MEWIFLPEAWVALFTLTILEIVLGIDNIIFISVLTSRLPAEQRPAARKIGLGLAMLSRLVLLFSLFWIIKLSIPLFSVFGQDISIRDLILILGGLFLIAKSTTEIHKKLEVGSEQPGSGDVAAAGYWSVIAQIAIIDMVFSIDSVITAIGMAKHVGVMATAIVIAVLVMMWFAGAISRFVDEHPTMKMLALSFLILIGTALVGDGLDMHIPKGYIYFAMFYSLAVEMLNIRIRRRPHTPGTAA